MKRNIRNILFTKFFSFLLHNLKPELQQEHALKRLQYKVFWRQRSRIQSLIEGDKSTKFLHQVTKVNFKRNHIHCLVNDHGTAISDPSSLTTHCKELLSKIYSNRDSAPPTTLTLANFLHRVLIEADNALLLAIPSKEEIKAITFSLGRDKALGLDGLNAIFYQAY